ncbi:MAG: peptide deformylase [Propionibacterium sp.]|nr:peptide deformylase [Propionibacterium sp.]
MDNSLLEGGTVLRITRWGEPVMHQPTAPITEFDDDLRQLIRDMFATMYAADGVGLAATQVGVSKAVFIYDCPDENDVRQRGVFCNPTVTLPEGRDRNLEGAEEGCLSLPGGFQSLHRPDRATCTGQDETGAEIEVVGTGLLARCLQHETDHLNGMVFGDRLAGRGRKLLYRQHESLAHRYPDDWPVTPKTTSAVPQPEAEPKA